MYYYFDLQITDYASLRSIRSADHKSVGIFHLLDLDLEVAAGCINEFFLKHKFHYSMLLFIFILRLLNL